MNALNWGMMSDGGAFESLMHALLYAEDPGTVLFGRPGPDAGQDARSADGQVVYQAKYRQGLDMGEAIKLALKELETIKGYRQTTHANAVHWKHASRWVLVANFSINPNDYVKWQEKVVPAFRQEGLTAEYWGIEILEGKLAQHPEIRDVFFGGENRVLVSLKEAHDFLAGSGLSLDVNMVGRNDEIEKIKEFAASTEKRVLPLVGPGGIGKSRLLYESLVTLAQNGWRVFWALPESMKRSTQWFRLLNGAQQTIVALDDPGLLNAVIEQLAAVERRNWRVIITTRTERAERLRPYRNHDLVQKPIELTPLDEQASQSVVKACIGNANPSWLHSVYTFTRGVPGWLCLVALLAKEGRLNALPQRADNIASIYVDSCLESLLEKKREQGRSLLRWLALWGTLSLEAESAEQKEILFLGKQGIPAQMVRDLLAQLVKTGIVKNWGMNKRLYAVEPMIVRQQILSAWLLRENNGAYEVSDQGKIIVKALVNGQIPAPESVLSTLSYMARMRLEESETNPFMKPIFHALETITRDGTLLDQYRVAGLLVKVGSADPESALDVLIAIRENVKNNVDVEIPLWGKNTYTHEALVTNLPWTLFQIAGHVFHRVVAIRYINEFRKLIALENAERLKADSGKEPKKLFTRLLYESKTSETFAQPAYELAVQELTMPASWPFVSLVVGSLLQPIRESTEWVEKWTLSFSRKALDPDSTEWKLAADLRDKVFTILREKSEPAFRASLWRVLAESHHSFGRAVLHGNVRGSAVAAYRTVLSSDLEKCKEILQTSPTVSVEEATAAREMWHWYLEYGGENDPVDLARQCEQIYNALPVSQWRLHTFFAFETEENLAPETQRVADAFRRADKPETIHEFFHAAKVYLEAARQGHGDLADNWRFSDLAKACFDSSIFESNPPSTALRGFVRQILSQPDPRQGDMTAWHFSVQLCRRYLFEIKKGNVADTLSGLQRLLEMTTAKSRLLWGIYANVHPLTTGTLTPAELDCLQSQESGFSEREWFSLLGAFCHVDCERVQKLIQAHFEGKPFAPVESRECMGGFICQMALTALRYEQHPAPQVIGWIIDLIKNLHLDGVLLGMPDLERLREKVDFRLTMVQFSDLIASRIALEQRPKPCDDFKIVPYDFAIHSWVNFDANNPMEVEAFHKLCQMALGQSFIALYWLPKYLAQIDSTGCSVANFVTQYLAKKQEIHGRELARLGYLASAYPDDSKAWMEIARPICEKAQTFSREDRERVFLGLARKETGVMSSAPGPDYYVPRLDTVVRMLANEPQTSPIRPYFEWALRRAEEELRHEEARVEEDNNG